jgi:acyl-coenzyme A thioesterase PaaI-like protein
MNRISSPLGQSASSVIKRVWGVLGRVPGGGTVMGRLLGRLAPYTGTIRPEVLVLEVGHAKVAMKERRGVRNHLGSVHAIALMNLGEAVTGLAMLFSSPDDARGIITHLGMDYLKKARGRITAECHCPVPSSSERKEYDVEGVLTDASGEVVARAHARWLIGPTSRAPGPR